MFTVFAMQILLWFHGYKEIKVLPLSFHESDPMMTLSPTFADLTPDTVMPEQLRQADGSRHLGRALVCGYRPWHDRSCQGAKIFARMILPRGESLHVLNSTKRVFWSG